MNPCRLSTSSSFILLVTHSCIHLCILLCINACIFFHVTFSTLCLSVIPAYLQGLLHTHMIWHRFYVSLTCGVGRPVTDMRSTDSKPQSSNHPINSKWTKSSPALHVFSFDLAISLKIGKKRL